MHDDVTAEIRANRIVHESVLAGLRDAEKKCVRGVSVNGQVEPAAATEPCHLTEQGNARRLVLGHGDDLLHCETMGRWFIFDGDRWLIDESREIHRRAEDTTVAIYAEAADAPDAAGRKAIASWAGKSESKHNLGAMIELAKHRVSVRSEQLDAGPWLLNLENGTTDMHTAVLREHRREDLITKLAPVEFDPAAECPRWMYFLERIMGESEQLVGFLQRAVGYSLTGDTSERVMFICYGTGANGKSTFLETLLAMFGDYGMRTPTETLLARHPGSIPNDIARLRGARFVTAVETGDNRRLAEATIKDLTGGDTISARFMRGEWFDFKPEFKLWLATNHKPVIRGTDRAIWDRIRLIPFSVTIPEDERDPHLKDKLADELPGIMAWAVRGCVQWQGGGLGVPDAVREATAEYRAEMDLIGAFLDECCEEDRSATVTAKSIYKAYLVWCEANGERPITQRRFGSSLTERGYRRQRGYASRHEWIGVRLTIYPLTDLAPNPD